MYDLRDGELDSSKKSSLQSSKEQRPSLLKAIYLKKNEGEKEKSHEIKREM